MESKPIRWWDPVTAVAFLLAMYVIADHLVMTEWTDGLRIIPELVLIGVILGFMIGYSKFRGWTVFLFSVIFTLFFVVWRLLTFTDPALSYNDQLIELGSRTWGLLLQFIRNEPPTDSLLFLVNMSLQYWLVSYLGAYSIIRYGKAAIPLTFALILEIVLDLNHYSTGRTGISTAIFVILAAVILARLNYLQRDRQWREDAVKIEQDTRSAFFRSSTMLIILFVFLGWMLSSYVQQLPKNGDDVNYFSTLFRDLRSRFENAANPLRGGNPVPTEHFGDFFSLGTGSELTDNVVMTVEANMRSIEGLPFYWRVRSYDKYENGIWASTVEDGETLADNDTKLTDPGYLERQLVTFDFYPRKNLTMLYAPGFPYRISRPVFIYRETVEGKIVDIPVVTVATILRSGGQYQLASLLGAPTEKQLREASTDYPQWVTNRYLQYSEDLPESIGILAQEITRDAQNIYDKTIAINNYLRNNIAYKRVIPQPPRNMDPVAWVLFDHKEAFCNYYAAAEVLMLRSLGIPARWVVGYTQGDYSPKDQTFTVKESDAHAWSEVYFPEYGWIEFEPTAAEDNLVRESGEPQPAQTRPIPTPIRNLTERDGMGDEDPREQQQTTRSSLILVRLRQPKNLGILGFILTWTLLLVFFDRQRRLPSESKLPVTLQRAMVKRGWNIPNFLKLWADYENLLPIEKEFLTIKRLNKLLKTNMDQSSTAAEHAAALSAKIPALTEPAEVLLDQLEHSVYGKVPTDLEVVEKAMHSIRKEAVKYGLTRMLGKLNFPDQGS